MCSRTTAVIQITDVFIMKHYHRLSASSQFSGSSQFFGITCQTPDLAKWYDVLVPVIANKKHTLFQAKLDFLQRFSLGSLHFGAVMIIRPANLFSKFVSRQNIRGLCGCSLKATQKQLQWTRWLLVLKSYSHMISPNYSTAAYTAVGFTHRLQKTEPLSCDIPQSGRIALAQVTYWKYSWTCMLLSLA